MDILHKEVMQLLKRDHFILLMVQEEIHMLLIILRINQLFLKNFSVN